MCFRPLGKVAKHANINKYQAINGEHSHVANNNHWLLA